MRLPGLGTPVFRGASGLPWRFLMATGAVTVLLSLGAPVRASAQFCSLPTGAACPSNCLACGQQQVSCDFSTGCTLSGCPPGTTEVGSTSCGIGSNKQCRQFGTAGNGQCSACPAGRYGLNCLPCPTFGGQVCAGAGTCADGISGSGQCFCVAGHNGNMCQYSSQTTCNGHGTPNFDGSCSCSTGYTGLQCENCAPSYFGYPSCKFCNASTTCSGNGTCNSQGNCVCTANHAGAACNTCAADYYSYPTCNFCQSATTCSGHGVCSSTGSCVCQTGFTGPNCNQDINECLSNPCQNGGQCANTPGSYVCLCPAGFTGAQCQTNVDDCASQPCQNGGQCVDGANAYMCQCPAGYAGTNCEQLVPTTPRAECVGPDPGNPALRIVVFGYERIPGAAPLELPVGPDNSVTVTGADAGDAGDIGQPTTLLAGLHSNAFSFRYDPNTQGVTWMVSGGSASPNAATPACGVPGPPGPAGPKGADGVDGAAGPQGADGFPGPSGAMGATGPQGPPGPQGSQGVPGAPGLIGPQGPQGPQGADGATGPAGVAGPAGPTGAAGPVGPMGPAGPAGATGPQGASGPQGPSGPGGPAGPQGATGAVGPIGPIGLGLSFVSVPVSANGPLVLPAGNASAIFMVSVLHGDGLELTLPAAAKGQSRFVTIRRLDGRGRVRVRAAAGEHIEAGHEVEDGHWRDSDTLVLTGRWDYLTLVSDGKTWFVFAEQR